MNRKQTTRKAVYPFSRTAPIWEHHGAFLFHFPPGAAFTAAWSRFGFLLVLFFASFVALSFFSVFARASEPFLRFSFAPWISHLLDLDWLGSLCDLQLFAKLSQQTTCFSYCWRNSIASSTRSDVLLLGESLWLLGTYRLQALAMDDASNYHQRKFRNLTSDYTESCRQVLKHRCYTAQMRDMRETLCFHSFVASKARKVSSEKRGGAEDRLPKTSTKFAPRCGETMIWESKSFKTGGAGQLFEVELRKICTALWRESDLEVKTVKNWHARRTFGS